MQSCVVLFGSSRGRAARRNRSGWQMQSRRARSGKVGVCTTGGNRYRDQLKKGKTFRDIAVSRCVCLPLSGGCSANLVSWLVQNLARVHLKETNARRRVRQHRCMYTSAYKEETKGTRHEESFRSGAVTLWICISVNKCISS